MKVFDIAVVGGGDRIEVDLLGQVLGSLTRDQIGRGRLDDALLVVADAHNHGRVGVHPHDNGELVLLKPDQIVVIAERLEGRLINAHVSTLRGLLAGSSSRQERGAKGGKRGELERLQPDVGVVCA